MSLVSSRRTYDTDSITLRRIFAYDLSNSPFSTGFILTSVTKGVATFLSPNFALSTIGVPNLPAQLSTLAGQLVSTFGVFTSNLPSSAQVFLPSTVNGLGSVGYVSTSYVTSTIIGLGTFGYLSSSVFGDVVTSTVTGLASAGYISTSQLTSTITGLASADYISSSQLTSTVIGLGSTGYISTLQLVSTVTGLGSANYISSSQLQSTMEGLGTFGYLSSISFYSTLDGVLPSTVTGLGSATYISSTQLTSSLVGLGSIGYVSSASLFSSINNLGTFGFISSLASTVRSTFSNQFTGNWCNAGFLYSNLGPFSTVKTFQFDLGAGMRNQIQPSTTNLDIEFKANLQFGYYDARSIQYDFSTCLVKGVSLNTSSIIAQENISYYILNANAVNLPFFFSEKYRFVLNDTATISTLKSDTSFSSLSLFHRIGISSPTTNQLFAFPAKPTSITVVLDNATRTYP